MGVRGLPDLPLIHPRKTDRLCPASGGVGPVQQWRDWGDLLFGDRSNCVPNKSLFNFKLSAVWGGLDDFFGGLAERSVWLVVVGLELRVKLVDLSAVEFAEVASEGFHIVRFYCFVFYSIRKYQRLSFPPIKRLPMQLHIILRLHKIPNRLHFLQKRGLLLHLV